VATDKRAAAVEWARRGFRVFPLEAGSKDQPLEKGFPALASADPAAVERRWTDPVTGWARDYNVGVLCNDLCVVDVDTRKGPGVWEAFTDLDLPLETLTVRTPSGGYHFYYRGPSTANSRGDLGFGIDTRSFNGYVVAPGSERDIGEYVILRDAPVADAPEHLIAKLNSPRERASAAPLVDLDKPEAVLRAIAYLEADAPLAVEGAGGDDLTYRVACIVKDMGVSETVALRLMSERWNDRCAPPWSPEELERKVANAYEYGTAAPGAAAPELDFDGVQLAEVEQPAAPVGGGAWVRHGDAWNTAQPWLFYKLLADRGVAGIVGPSQSGKTFLCTHLAHSLATGRKFFGQEPDERGGTIVVFGGTEGSGFVERLAALGADETLPISGLRVGPLSERGSLDRLLAEITQEADRMRLEFGVPLRLVILETLSASGLLEDETDNAKCAEAINALAALSLKLQRHVGNGVLVLFTHHPPKEGRGARGGGALFNNSDYFLEVLREGNETVRKLELTKGRNAPIRVLGGFTLPPVELGQDERGRPVTSCVISESDAPASDDGPGASVKLMRFFAECVELSTVKRLGQRDAVEVDEVRGLFHERYYGKRNRAAMDRQFRNARAAAEERGAVQAATADGRDYFLLLKLET
jgi:hypothetical protein